MTSDTNKLHMDALDHHQIGKGRLYTWILFHLLVIILLPFFLFESAITEYGQRLIDSQPTQFYLAIMVILALTLDVLLPIPASIVSLASSVIIGGVPGAIALFLGLMLGSLFGYVVGRYARHGLLGKLLTPESRSQLTLISGGKGILMLVLARPIPVLAEASVILAGIDRYSFKQFVLVCLLSNGLVTFMYMALATVANH